MRSDILINDVLEKCEVLKKAGLWAPEPRIRPRAWIQNFEKDDRAIAAILLDKFIYYNQRFTDALLLAAYHSIGDGLPKRPLTLPTIDLVNALKSAIFTPVKGEHPNPTDSGYLLCRWARQHLGVPEALVVETPSALMHAYNGNTVVFLDDFIGSGDQFFSTWESDTVQGSFKDAHSKTGFVAIYITLITTDWGLANIYERAPEVTICATHILEKKHTVWGLAQGNAQTQEEINNFLFKYSNRLTPKEEYIANNLRYRMYGYKERGLLFAFDHSIPDATLPIFWSPGKNNWEPLIERN